MEKSNDDNDRNLDKIKVFSSEDENLKVLGELLSNKSSRGIIKLLLDKEMYTNEIAKKIRTQSKSCHSSLTKDGIYWTS